jgi:hypothetical protein
MRRPASVFFSLSLVGFGLAGSYFYFLFNSGEHLTTQTVFTICGFGLSLFGMGAGIVTVVVGRRRASAA